MPNKYDLRWHKVLKDKSQMPIVSPNETTYHLWASLQVQKIQKRICVVFYACCRHCLGIRDVRIVSIHEDTRIGYVFCEKISGPELAVRVSPCLDWMIIPTTRIEAMNEDKAE